MTTQYLTTPPAHVPLFIWGNAGSKTGKYFLTPAYSFTKYIEVNVVKHVIEGMRDYYVSVSDRGNARFSKKAAEDCAAFVRKKIRQNAYSSMVPPLSKEWATTKNRLKLAHQVGMATEQMVRNISAFRTNIKDSRLKETKHTGYVVGINQKADFSKDPEKVNKILSSKVKKPNKLRKSYKSLVKGKSIYRFGADFQNAKLYWLEHGKKIKNRKGSTISRQPPRPIYTKAVEEFIRTEFKVDDFVGQLKIGSNGMLGFKFKAHK